MGKPTAPVTSCGCGKDGAVQRGVRHAMLVRRVPVPLGHTRCLLRRGIAVRSLVVRVRLSKARVPGPSLGRLSKLGVAAVFLVDGYIGGGGFHRGGISLVVKAVLAPMPEQTAHLARVGMLLGGLVPPGRDVIERAIASLDGHLTVVLGVSKIVSATSIVRLVRSTAVDVLVTVVLSQVGVTAAADRAPVENHAHLVLLAVVAAVEEVGASEHVVAERIGMLHMRRKVIVVVGIRVFFNFCRG
mmetsp:Transcript_26724/g.67010  ORF Transcript_26724/g.67010 Transcript_26724/m.67010 type:complete len:243 (-) Transcript_26724:389-1117(-)